MGGGDAGKWNDIIYNKNNNSNNDNNNMIYNEFTRKGIQGPSLYGIFSREKTWLVMGREGGFWVIKLRDLLQSQQQQQQQQQQQVEFELDPPISNLGLTFI